MYLIINIQFEYIREQEDAVLDDRENEWLDEEMEDVDEDAADDEDQNSSDDSGSSQGAEMSNTNVQTNDDDEETEDQYSTRTNTQVQCSEQTSHDGRRNDRGRYRNINELTRLQGMNLYDGVPGLSGGSTPLPYFLYGVESENSRSSNQEYSSEHNSYVEPETSLVSSIFGPTQPAPWYFYTQEDNENIQPARHSFWQ